VSLTTGRGPLSDRPAGRFNAAVPDGLTYVEPFRRRVRAVAGGREVVDCERALLVHRAGRPPAYAFPAEDVDPAVAEPEPEAPGHVHVPWEAADAWYEEDERVHGHPRNPYHRVDCVLTSRRLVVELGGVTLVDTHDTVGVYETALDPRLYVARRHVRAHLSRSATTTYCPYKGTASYWTAAAGDLVVADVAWSYEDPLPESTPLAGLLGFDPERARVVADLPPGGTTGGPVGGSAP
jgi:uncharacterized protein (DUF427 family)